MERPVLLNTRWSSHVYKKEEYYKFFEGLNHAKEDISNKSLYLMSKEISQNKIREAGFKIVRDIDSADVVVINNYLNLKNSYESTNIDSSNNKYKELRVSANSGVEEFIQLTSQQEPTKYTYIFDSELYKYLYKYTGNLELYNQINDLLDSRDNSNIQMAMEFMSNANWNNNEIYLQQLFNDFWLNMRAHSYRTSISFTGFLTSLNFDYSCVRFYSADDYRNLCKTEEHHEWVKDKFNKQFEEELKNLFETYKMKIDKLEYSIDYAPVKQQIDKNEEVEI